MKYEQAIRLQARLSRYIIKKDVIKDEDIRYIAGVDVSYKDNKAYPCIVITDRMLKMVYHRCEEMDVDVPYIPGLLFLREGNIMLNILKKDKDRYDLIMVDGNGILHPRRFGLASYIGFMLKKPTIGVAKSLLCGKVKDGYVIDNDEIIGKVVNKSYVSIGNMISLETATQIVSKVCRYNIPEPIRLADIFSRKYISYRSQQL